MNFAILSFIIGFILQFEALFLLLPWIVGMIYGEYHVALIYLVTAAICFILGKLLSFRHTGRFKELYVREGFTAVALGWFVMSVFGAIPFVLTGEIPFYIDALFETISGFTTTGSSILSDVEALSYASLFWRSFTHWIGGMGVFVFIMAILPMMGGSTMNLMRAESPGPSVSKLVPRVRDTAKILYGLYMTITVLGVIMLCLCGMPLFDSLCTTFGSVGTGGFGVKNSSIGGYSPLIQNAVTVLMILSGVNYTVYFCLLRKQFKEAFSNDRLEYPPALCNFGRDTATLLFPGGNDHHHHRICHHGFQYVAAVVEDDPSASDDDRRLCRQYRWRYKGIPCADPLQGDPQGAVHDDPSPDGEKDQDGRTQSVPRDASFHQCLYDGLFYRTLRFPADRLSGRI